MVLTALDHTRQAAGVGGGWYGQSKGEGIGLAQPSTMLGSKAFPLESVISDSMKTRRYIRTLFIVS